MITGIFLAMHYCGDVDKALNPLGVPLLNTAILLSSGVTVTWAHHEILEGRRFEAIKGLLITVHCKKRGVVLTPMPHPTIGV